MIEHQLFQAIPGFRTHHETITTTTSDAPEFIDLTDELQDIVSRSHIEMGIVVIFSTHTTAAIKINESEPELLKDMALFLSEIAPIDRDYHHNNFDVRTVNMEPGEVPNAHAHCQHLLLSASESVPVVGGQMALGRWQRVFLIELDRPKMRQVTVQVIGT
jgi:secondary thiamine-phosphate synthase enzyme